MTKIAVENVNTPGKTTNVDAEKYTAMREAMMAAMTSSPMTYDQIKAGVLETLSQELFPGGDKAGWWIKCVQLDLEAKGVIQRHKSKPLTWSKT